MKGSNHELSVNKLIILYMIEKLDMPMSYTQISEFLLAHEYMNYFSLQQYFSELVETNLLATKVINHSTRYSITENGKKTLEYFENRIPESICTEILNYLKDKKLELKDEFEITAEYYPKKNGDFTVNCIAKEKKDLLMEIKINVVSKEHALKICDNWKENPHVIYGKILEELLKS
ncbi:DUF4364 family protein [Vallitalea sp.]|jgi:DNA-binding PadR family transcriptional regulator|uniref:DUF4364 family protein n=1 Tax=Vallitalea sp. TaxID=1882829 RepID=UPI0025E2620B|nr:DUF4364 family protein [Vallitalea sp.]MCT4685881.1 DUF4364 family protein [Vallitalea sp.]